MSDSSSFNAGHEARRDSRVYGLSSVPAVIDAARALDLRVTATSSEFDRTGLDFAVVHAIDECDTRWILRTPRRPEVIASARVEARVLKLVAPRLPVSVPSWRIHTDALIGYPRLDGVPAITLGENGPTWHVVDPASPSDVFVDSYARMLAALQKVDVGEAVKAGVPVRSVARARSTIAMAMEATRKVLSPSESTWRRWQRWLTRDDLWPERTALVHGDLHPGHMLLAPTGELTGVLDWTEAQVTDPSVDLALFFGCFGADALARMLVRFVREGGAVSSGLAEHAAERWAAFPALVADWGLRTDDPAVIEHARGLLVANSGAS